MIFEPAKIAYESTDWVVLEISKSCWVVLSREAFKQGLRLGRAWKRHLALQARLQAEEER